jgi:pantoate--beta-alanine ligase
VRVVENIVDFRTVSKTYPDIGFVPTMGYLHAGHLELARRAREDSQTVVASIFVNPTQFGPNEDFESYPRDISGDLHQLEKAGVDVVFVPPVEEIYPKHFQTYVDVTKVTQMLEGERRSGHFRGDQAV